MNDQYTIQFYATSDDYQAVNVPRNLYWERFSDGKLYFDKAIQHDADGKYEAHLCVNGRSVDHKHTNHQIEA